LDTGIQWRSISDHERSFRNPGSQAGGYAMMDYRCYHLNPVGRFIAVEVYQCSTDAEACDRAHVIMADQQWGAFELWQLDRKVATFTHKQ